MYNIYEWLLFFYFYSFAGWIWESCYDSIKDKHWINRGFIHGPLIPIYGTGAVVVLAASLPFKEHLIGIFLGGMLAATVLEYITGCLMDMLFHVRYWDYSEQPFNLNGHICLFCSLGWGIFSVTMDFIVHPHVADLLLSLNELTIKHIVYTVSAFFILDFMISFHEAMDFRYVLIKITENHNELSKMQTRLETMAILWGENLSFKKELAIEGTKAFGLKIPGVNYLYKKASTYLESVDTLEDTPLSRREELKFELTEITSRLKQSTSKLLSKSNRLKFYTSKHIIDRNPNSVSSRYSDALNIVKNFKRKYSNSEEDTE